MDTTYRDFKKTKTKIICIAYRVGNAILDNRKHDASFNMPAIWYGLQRFNTDAKKTQSIAEFLDKNERDTKFEEKIIRFEDMLYSLGENRTAYFLASTTRFFL